MFNVLKKESVKPSVPQEEKKEKRDKTIAEKPMRWYSFRLFPIWLRILLVLILLIIAAVSGLMIGFGVIGDGEAMNVLKWGTWQHIIDLMEGKE
ncbi:DNA-directed RNA polymerase subunit beta [Ureibacillus sp. 179-F W5.1 NHS]|nr:DNA-directed RNA polymerase subunit beta [Lysinibacillus halotolerans]